MKKDSVTLLTLMLAIASLCVALLSLGIQIGSLH